MSQDPREGLQDLLRDLREARQDSEEQRRLGAALLGGLGVFSRPKSMQEVARELIAVLRNALDFEDAFLLVVDEFGDYRVGASTSSQFDDSTWPIGSFLGRVLDGAVLPAFDVDQVAEWADQPDALRHGARSALHAAIGGGGYRTILVCTHPSPGFFGQSHVRIMEGFVPLASQGMLLAWMRAVASVPTAPVKDAPLSAFRIGLLDHALETLAVGAAVWSRDTGVVQANPFLEEMVAPAGGVKVWWERVKETLESVVEGTCSTCGGLQCFGSRYITLPGLSGRDPIELQVSFAGHSHGDDLTAPIGETILTRYVTEPTIVSRGAEELALLRSADRDPVLRVDASGVLLFANAAADPLLEQWGVRPGDRVAGVFRELIAIARARGVSPVREVDVGGRAIELRFVAPSQMDQAVVYGRDVTEERRTQRALEASEARKSLLIEASLDAVVTMDHEGRIVDWGPRASELFGWSEKEAVGQLMSELIIPHSFREAHQRGLRHFLASGEGSVLGKRIEVPALLRSGVVIPVELFITVLDTGDSELLLFAGFIRDIREQKRASTQLEAVNSRLSALIRSTGHGVLFIGEDGLITVVNERLRSMFDIEPSTEELIGALGDSALRQIAGFVEDSDTFFKGMLGMTAAAGDSRVDEFTLVDGRILEREYSSVLAEEQVLGHLWQFRDITVRRRAEAAVRQARSAEVRLGGQVQELFLRGQPPERHPMLDIALLSVPSQGLDGDFVDFVEHGRYRLDVMVGDVMGKGLAASLLGAATKNSFARALAAGTAGAGDLPATSEVLRQVHNALARRLMSVDSFVTVMYSRFDLSDHVMHYVGCGHPGVIHYQHEARECSVLVGQDPPIGFVKENEYTTLRTSFEPGDVLVLYSDGITETFSPSGEMLGEARLVDAIRASGDQSASEIVRKVKELIIDFSGGAAEPSDDLTLVVIRVRHAAVHYEGDVEVLLIHRDAPRLSEMRAFLEARVDQAYPDIEASFAFEISRATQEAVTNVLRHAGPKDPDIPIALRVEASPEELVVEVRYEGSPFEPGEVGLPDLSILPEGGFGLFIIDRSVDEVSYGIAADGRNSIRMVKRVVGR